jgi:hypothetical protein
MSKEQSEDRDKIEFGSCCLSVTGVKNFLPRTVTNLHEQQENTRVQVRGVYVVRG